ncbi:uncharacterized protein [Triticum aestivum]|uniref:uncharacterized protein isoform X1 n=1 Tax=Triticum aestivum TaxID=4565 RepID=UPI001D00ABE2|nr:uncharacterized protein LOC123070297 isoform X1 [Triticum aestivum]
MEKLLGVGLKPWMDSVRRGGTEQSGGQGRSEAARTIVISLLHLLLLEASVVPSHLIHELFLAYMKGCMLFILQAPELFTQGGDPAFFTARGSVSHLFVRATRRGLALLHVSCNKDQPLAILLIRVHVLKSKKIPYWIWTLTSINKFSLSRRGHRGDRRGLPQPCGRRALQPLGGGLHREARRPRRTDDRPGDRNAGGRRGGGP